MVPQRTGDNSSEVERWWQQEVAAASSGGSRRHVGVVVQCSCGTVVQWNEGRMRVQAVQGRKGLVAQQVVM